MPVAVVAFRTDKQWEARRKLAVALAEAMPSLVCQAFERVGLRQLDVDDVKASVRPYASEGSINVEPLEVTVKIGRSHAERQVALRNTLFELVREHLVQDEQYVVAEVGTVEVDVHVVPMSGGVVALETGEVLPTWGDKN